MFNYVSLQKYSAQNAFKSNFQESISLLPLFTYCWVHQQYQSKKHKNKTEENNFINTRRSIHTLYS